LRRPHPGPVIGNRRKKGERQKIEKKEREEEIPFLC
jgi:hypothetical protein